MYVIPGIFIFLFCALVSASDKRSENLQAAGLCWSYAPSLLFCNYSPNTN